MNRLVSTLVFAFALSACGDDSAPDVDASMDMGMDTSEDVGVDGGVDSDVPDAPGDTGSDAMVDAGADTTVDTGPDLCFNGAQDDSETDVDCGGVCDGCPAGLMCDAGADCESGACLMGVCRANEWTEVASIPIARSHFAITRASDGRVYVFGGESSGTPSDHVHVYNPTLDAWAALEPMPTARSGVSAAQASNGRIYVVGGETVRDAFRFQPGTTRTVESFDPEAGTWRAEPDMPEGHGEGGAVFYDGELIVFGGIGGGELEDGAPGAPMPNTIALNEDDGTWASVTGRLSADQREFGYAVMDEVGVFAVGGWRTSFRDSGLVDAVDLYDGSAWFTREGLPEATHAPSAASLDGVLYVFGGLTTGPTRIVEEVRAYIASDDAWSVLPPAPISGDFGGAVALDEERILVMPGRTGSDGRSASDEVWIYRP